MSEKEFPDQVPYQATQARGMTEPKRAEPNEHARELRRIADFSSEELSDYSTTVEMVCDEAAAEIERLAARVRELERDAERYRFLRNLRWSDGKIAVVLSDGLMVGHQTFSDRRLDEIIDSMIPAGPESKPDQETKGER